jgi:alkylation response protein AidB-like acyl-CoA dehydrogenase
MSTVTVNGSTTPAVAIDDNDPIARFRPIFDSIRSGAVDRDRSRTLPREEVRALAAAGFGAVRLPVELGGLGFTIPQLAEALTALAAADSNLAQIFRGHFAFAEDRLVAPPGEARTAWLDRIAAGELIGNAWSETTNALGATATTLSRADDGWRVHGRKYYTTGSIFSDWIDATVTGPNGAALTALIRVDQKGVTVSDDWDGFGQPTTGTGTAVFDGARVAEGDVFAFSDRFRYQTAFYQLVLLSTLAGIARAVERDTGEQVRNRSRVYSHGSSSTTRTDPQILAVAGEISSAAFVADAAVARVAAAIQRAYDTAGDRDSEADRVANVTAEITSAQAQVVLTRLVPHAATQLFDTLGASGVSRDRGLDRHWRNARVVSSHNPVLFKARIVGNWSVNGAAPEFIWAIGTPEASTSDAT